MKSPFKFKSNPQAFRASLYITLFAFILELIFFQFISSNSDSGNQTLLNSVLYFLILFIIVRITIEIYIRKYIRIRVSKILNELNPEIVKDFSEDKNLEIITDEIITKARERRSEINVLKNQENYRREFLGNISHELKTPLFSIQGYIENILDDPEIDSTTLQNFLKKANKNASRLGQIVKDLDAITKFESGVLHIQKNVFDIAQLVNEVIEELEIQASNK